MIELLRKRRTIRKFKDQKIDKKELEILKEGVLRSPASRAIDPWEFIFVDQKDLIADLAKSKQHGSAFMKNAPLAIVVCADVRKSDVWIEDCSIASIIIQLIGESLGLGSCWVQIRNRRHDNQISSVEYVQKLLKMPSYMQVESIIAIGYPQEKRESKKFDKLAFDKIHINEY